MGAVPNDQTWCPRAWVLSIGNVREVTTSNSRQGTLLTYSLDDHVNSNGQIDQLHRFVERRRDSWYGREVDVGRKRTEEGNISSDPQ